MKKLISSILCVLMVVFLWACASSPKLNHQDFEKWIQKAPEKIVGNTEYSLYSILNDPKNIGIEMDAEKLNLNSYKDYKASMKENEKMLEMLSEFDYDSLNKDQKITYDVLKYSLEAAKDDYFYISTNYFDVNSGVQSSLALNINFMKIQSKEVLDSLLGVMESTTTMFPKYVDFEEVRQDKGYGMSKTYMEEVLKQVHTFNVGDHSYLLEGIRDKIEKAIFLSIEEKVEYKAKLQTIYEKNFLPAYKQLEVDLGNVKIKTKDKDASLADYPEGKEYYTSLIKHNTGFDSVKEYRKFLKEERNKISLRAQKLLYKYPELQTEFIKPSQEAAKYTSLSSVSEVLAFLEEKINTNKDFPKLENVQYSMDVVPKSLQNIFKAAAAYFVGPLDDPRAPEQMILNGAFSQGDYNTIAHEGFPGHMYQFHYFRNTKHNIVRDLLANTGYSEGWAVYASKQMSKYADDPAMCAFQELNEELTYLYILEIDNMIHYDNASRSEIYKYMEEEFGIMDEESKKVQYEQLLEGPALFSPYYGFYFRLLNLKEETKKEWKEYSEYKFNKKILDLGALPYDLLEEYVLE